MIRSYFNLKKMPFQKNIAPDELFRASSFTEGINRLDYLKNNFGFMLLTGDPGTGKSSLLRYFTNNLNLNAFQFFYTPLSTVSILDFYRQINFLLTGSKAYRKADLFRSIQQGIKMMVKNQKKVPILILDEAHLLKNENFYELQIIFNFEFDSVNPGLVIVCGQSHLRDRLSRDILTSFRDRISIKYHLTPLSKEELSDYIKHSLHCVGGSKDLFNEAALVALFNNTQGNPRLVSKLAHSSLMATAFNKKSFVTEEEVYQASKEI